MATQIKRLFQQNAEFVPITLAEAVVVNTNDTNLPQLGITTLDKVLYTIIGNNQTNINQVVTNINKLLENKQDKITWGEGFKIESDGTVNLVNSVQLYKIVTELPKADKECENRIYLLPSSGGVSGNIWRELICVYSPDSQKYIWEEIGTVQTSVDLSGYITRTEYESALSGINTSISNINTTLASTISAQNVTNSSGESISVNYEIPDTLYDDV